MVPLAASVTLQAASDIHEVRTGTHRAKQDAALGNVVTRDGGALRPTAGDVCAEGTKVSD